MGPHRCDGKDHDSAVEVALLVLFVVLAALAWASLSGVFALAG